jgi:hypothetical protein
MRKIAFTVIFFFLAVGVSLSKCANRVIHVEGSLDGGSTDGYGIVLQVTPDPNREPQPEIAIKDGRFSGDAVFNGTKSEGNVRDDCSRVPQIVDVVLLKKGQELSRARLEIAKDFVRDKLGDYKLRTPVILHPPA